MCVLTKYNFENYKSCIITVCSFMCELSSTVCTKMSHRYVIMLNDCLLVMTAPEDGSV